MHTISVNEKIIIYQYKLKTKVMFKNHPKGLLNRGSSNMGERFGYYIMNAVLVLFLCSKFGLSEAASGTIYSFFYAGI